MILSCGLLLYRLLARFFVNRTLFLMVSMDDISEPHPHNYDEVVLMPRAPCYEGAEALSNEKVFLRKCQAE